MVAHHKIIVFRNLVWEFNIAFAQRLFRNIRLVQFLVVDVDGAFVVDPDVIAGDTDDPFDQNLV